MIPQQAEEPGRIGKEQLIGVQGADMVRSITLQYVQRQAWTEREVVFDQRPVGAGGLQRRVVGFDFPEMDGDDAGVSVRRRGDLLMGGVIEAEHV